MFTVTPHFIKIKQEKGGKSNAALRYASSARARSALGPAQTASLVVVSRWLDEVQVKMGTK